MWERGRGEGGGWASAPERSRAFLKARSGSLDSQSFGLERGAELHRDSRMRELCGNPRGESRRKIRYSKRVLMIFRVKYNYPELRPLQKACFEWVLTIINTIM